MNMNKKFRVLISIVVVIMALLFISFPFILNSFIDKDKLNTIHNKEIFDSLVLNIKICLFYNNPKEKIDSNWLSNYCENMGKVDCDYIEYQDNRLTLQNCSINNQLFSYENGEILVH